MYINLLYWRIVMVNIKKTNTGLLHNTVQNEKINNKHRILLFTGNLQIKHYTMFTQPKHTDF